MPAFLLSFPGCSFNAHAEEAPGNNDIIILKQEDAAPRAAQKLSQRIFTGDGLNGDCSFYELQLGAEQYAAQTGANVLKIVSRAAHSRKQRCDKIEVAFYRADNPHEAEQSFRWDASRPLTWDDFRGGIRHGASNNIAAETSCGIGIETNLVSSGGVVHVYAFNTFDKRESWVRAGFERIDVLLHEQGHWDICELYTRKMQARFDATNISGANIHQAVSAIYDAVSAEYLARQEQYEQETQHGIVETEQKRWMQMIGKELAASSLSKL